MVTAAPEAWRAMLASRPDLAREPLVAGWADAGHPLVARRLAQDDPPGAIPLGLPLPPAQGKRRLALSLPPEAIANAAPPPLLRVAASAAPDAWRASLWELLTLDEQVRTFGGLAWTHLTGLPYLSAASDLDLLWSLPDPGSVDRLLGGIEAIAARAPIRIDGEVIGAAGAANWRELHTAGEVMVKHLDGLRLMTRAEFLAEARP